MPVAPPDRDTGRSTRHPRRVAPRKPRKVYRPPQSFRTEAASGQGYPSTPRVRPTRPPSYDTHHRFTLPLSPAPRGDAGHAVTPSQRAAIDRGVRDARLRVLRKPKPAYHITRAQYLGLLAEHERGRARQARVLSPALTALDQLSRPVHGIAAGTRAAIHGQNVPSAIGRGVTLKDRALFSDVLGDLGAHGLLKSIGGFGLDVALDPTTYLSAGTTSVARHAAEAEARKATAAALRAGASKAAADRAGRAAASKTLATETNRGLQVGFAGRKTSGRASARIDRALRLDKAGERIRGSGAVTLAKQVNPRIRPAGVDSEEFTRVRAAMRRGRAITATGEHHARNLAQAVARALPGDAHPRVIDALEHRTLQGLSPGERKVTLALHRHFDALYRAERAKGLVGRKFGEFGYFPRRPLSELDRPGRGAGGTKLASSKARTNRQPYSAFRGTKHDVYTQNAAVATYLRGRDSAVKLGRKEVIDELHSVGRKYRPGMSLSDHDAIYTFKPGEMPVEVKGHELDRLMASHSGRQMAAVKAAQRARTRGATGGEVQALAEKAAAEAPEFRVLNRNLVRVAEQHVPQRLEGVDDLVHRVWDRQVQGRVKTALTVVNPQYHLTNLYGDLYNAYLAQPVVRLLHSLGVSTRAMVYRARTEAAAKTLGKQLDPSMRGVKIGGRKVPLDELVKEAETHGAIGQGFIGRDLAEVLDHQGKEAAQRAGQGKIARRTRIGQRVATSRVGSKATHPIQAIRDLSQYREDAVRLATYLGARKRGLSPDAAVDVVNRFHFDYGDLTTFERSVLRRVLPFYTFTARNTPLQLRSLLERPGKIANLEKLREEAAKAVGMPPGWESQLQPWEQEGQPIPLGRHKDGTPQLLFLKLPSTDIKRLNLSLTDQSNYLMSMLTPVIKAPVEYTQNYNFFFRSKIDDLLDAKDPTTGEQVRTLKPAPKWLVGVARKAGGDGLLKALHIRQFTDQKSGKRIWGWPAKLDYLLKQTPLSGTALQFGTDVPNTRGQSQGQRLFGFLTGLKVAPFDEAAIKQRRLGDEYGFLQNKAKAMRSQGDAYTASGSRTSKYQAVLDRQREVGKALGVGANRKRPSLGPSLSDEARSALQGASQVQLSPEARDALRSLSAP